MNLPTPTLPSPRSRLALTLGLATLAAAPLLGQSSPNYLVVGVGGATVDGDRAAFTARQDRPWRFVGGLEDLHFEQWTKDGAFLVIDARAVAEQQDYRLAIEYSKPEAFAFFAGFEQFRQFSHGVSIAVPGSAFWSTPFDPELSLDRSKLWFEGRIQGEGRPEVRLRYTMTTREGSKASTAWGDSTLAGGTKNIIPSFRDLDEVRHEVLLDVIFRPDDDSRYAGGLRWQQTDTNNALQIQRRPGESADRNVSHREAFSNDLFSVHGSAERQVTEKLRLTSGANWTTLSGTMGLDRIYGDSYDAVFDPVFARRQVRDHGVLNLSGRSDLKQFVATVNALYQPTEKLTIVPSLRLERTYSDASSEWTDTEIASGSLLTQLHETALENTREYNLGTASLEGRYTGVKNWTFTGGIMGSRGTGNMAEQLFDNDVPTARVLTLDRDNDDTRTTFQADLGAHWRITPQVRVSFGARHKQSKNTNEVISDSTSNAIVGGDRYPSYIESQRFEAQSVNARLYWRLNSKLTSISRVDFQTGTTDSQTFFILGVQSRDYERLVLSQSLAVQPLTRLSIQGSINVVSDLLSTPANTAPGQPRHGLVTESDQGYMYGHVTAFYSVSDNTDLQLTYQAYLVDAYVDNSAASITLGPDLDEQTVTARLTHRFSENVQVSLDYGFQRSRNLATAGRTDYDAHMFGSRLQYRF